MLGIYSNFRFARFGALGWLAAKQSVPIGYEFPKFLCCPPHTHTTHTHQLADYFKTICRNIEILCILSVGAVFHLLKISRQDKPGTGD
jgi:hypothetical protein